MFLFMKGKVVLADGTHDLYLMNVRVTDPESFTDEKAAEIVEEFRQKWLRKSKGISAEVEWVPKSELESAGGPIYKAFCAHQ